MNPSQYYDQYGQPIAPPSSSGGFVSPPRSSGDATHVPSEPNSSFNATDRNARISTQAALLQAPDYIGAAMNLLPEDAREPSPSASFSGTQQIGAFAWGSQRSTLSREQSSTPFQSGPYTAQHNLADPLGPTLDNYTPSHSQPAHSLPRPSSHQPNVDPNVFAMQSSRLAADSNGALFCTRNVNLASVASDPGLGGQGLRWLAQKYKAIKVQLFTTEAALGTEIDNSSTSNEHLVDLVDRVTRSREDLVHISGLMAAQAKALRPTPDVTVTPASPTPNQNLPEAAFGMGMSDFDWGMYRL